MIPMERIERSILLIRGQKVLLDSDLAELYGVEVKRLVEAVRRNPDRFPDDFKFRLTIQEVRALRSQFATSNAQHAEKPEDFDLSTNADKNQQIHEDTDLRSRIVTSNPQSTERINNSYSGDSGRGGRAYLPYVFTEQGVAMLSSVLNSPRAVSVNIEIMPAYA